MAVLPSADLTPHLPRQWLFCLCIWLRDNAGYGMQQARGVRVSSRSEQPINAEALHAR